MTVYIEKNALNLREELASLRNQGGYQEQKFYFDGLVTNGTFDTDTTGWTNTSATLSIVGGEGLVTSGGGFGYVRQSIPTVIGKTYAASCSARIGTTNTATLSLGGVGASTSSATPTTLSVVFTATATSAFLWLQVGNAGTAYFDDASVYETDGTDVIHTMPAGWKPKDFYEDGLLQREGALNDYEVIYDGFDYVIKPTVAPAPSTQTCVIGVKA
jgi:hypothetical protein